MYHSRNKLLRSAVWLKVISWYFLLLGMIGFFYFINSFLNTYPALPFSVGEISYYRTPDWTDWGSVGVLFFQQITNPILYFLMFQGLASAIHFMLAYYYRKTSTPE